MKVLEVENLVKKYPSFELKNVSFFIEEGHIVGLIGRNGAGKSTILKSILNLIQSDGRIEFFGLNFRENEQEIKENIGFVSGGFDYYQLKTIKAISKATSIFYSKWDDQKYRGYLNFFGLDENKKIKELSEGMKVKFSITLALSHNAKLLIMDEPTSGLDPLSREEFCDLILDLVKKTGVTVLFSTHITSDLMRISDDLIYVSNGEVLMSDTLENVLNAYKLVKFDAESDIGALKEQIIGLKQVKNGFEGLIKSDAKTENLNVSAPSLDEIMVHLEIEGGRK